MGIFKKILAVKGTKDLALNLTKKKFKQKGRGKDMFKSKYKKKPNIVSRIAKAALVAGAGAYVLKKNQDEVKATVTDAKEKANRAKDDMIDAFNGEDLE